ncbi:tRNA (adenosine(37)-N6)-threonylcarbamoyltransferase complex dimerization subunit type 1 TsaB, partial [Candidatus Peregrinibacteria bacterium]|nr:tRNA (adenosine(37)-N6)-threonylcarbamoyltransferase complex dimerization subunit type 1 TsaB [Candidatus Peregrinibacteria bacterium]
RRPLCEARSKKRQFMVMSIVGQEYSCPTIDITMNCLFFDLASHNGLLACVKDDAMIASKLVDHRLDDHELVPAVEKLLRDAGWTYQDLKQIACMVGPGGFTSLRVAVAFANTIAWSLKIPSGRIHLSDLYAARVGSGRLQSAAAESDFVWLHSTKKTEFFVRGFGSYKKKWPEPVHITLEDLVKNLSKGISICGELIPEHRSVIAGAGVHELPLQNAEAILPAFLKNVSFENKTLEPWYGRSW